MKKFFNWLANNWLKVIGYGLAGLIVSFLLFFRLGTLVPNFSLSEQTAIANANKARKIADNPLYAPHKAIQWSIQRAGFHGTGAMRSVSAVYGAISIVALYVLLRLWHTERVAVFGTALFAASSWFLHTARLATPEILSAIFILVTLSITYLSAYSKKRSPWLLLLLVITVAGGLYVPGVVYVLMPILVWKSGAIKSLVLKVKLKYTLLIGVIGAACLVPLAYAFVRDFGLIKDWLLIPENFPTVRDLIHNAVSIPAILLVQAPSDPVLGLGNLPLLDAFSGIMFVLGLYYWERQLSMMRLIFGVITAFVVLVLLAAINSRETLGMLLLPISYLVIISGIIVLLQQWFTVFPRNPLARSVGIAAMTVVIGLTALYHISRYFIAWPNTPETKEAFIIPAQADKPFWRK